MRTIRKFSTIAFLTLLALTACQKEIVTYNNGYDDGTTPHGAPSITGIILASDTAGTPKFITKAAMGQMITIRGENLSQVKSLTFNGLETDLKTVYAVNSAITVPIPRKLFDESQADGKVVVTTLMGTTSANLQVDVPKLVVEGFYNEFGAAGDTLQVVGDNFDLFELEQGGRLIVEGSGEEIELRNVTRNSFNIAIPTTMPDSTIFAVTSDVYQQYGGSNVRFAFRYTGISFMLKNIETSPYDNYGSYDTWSNDGNYYADGTKAGEPKPNAGIPWYFRITGQPSSDWVFAGGLNVDADNIDIFNNLANYYLVFEVLTKEPFTDGSFDFEWAGTKAAWLPGKEMALDTYGKWKTMRLEAATYCLGTASSGWNNFAVQYSKKSDNVTLDISFSNLRLVEKLN
jgi:hypothetical protein